MHAPFKEWGQQGQHVGNTPTTSRPPAAPLPSAPPTWSLAALHTGQRLSLYSSRRSRRQQRPHTWQVQQQQQQQGERREAG
jgi:hypothetical protein